MFMLSFGPLGSFSAVLGHAKRIEVLHGQGGAQLVLEGSARLGSGLPDAVCQEVQPSGLLLRNLN